MESPPLVTALERGPGASFAELAARYLEEYLAKIRLAVARLDEDQVWWRPRPGANSVGNLLLHLRGNLSLWILSLVGGQALERRRSEEFGADRSHRRDELVALLAEVVDECRGVLAALDPEELERPVAAQGYRADVRGAVFHAVEHMSYHTGQILWVVKELTLGERPFELYPQHRKE